MNNLQVDPKRFAEIAFEHFEELYTNKKRKADEDVMFAISQEAGESTMKPDMNAKNTFLPFYE